MGCETTGWKNIHSSDKTPKKDDKDILSILLSKLCIRADSIPDEMRPKLMVDIGSETLRIATALYKLESVQFSHFPKDGIELSASFKSPKRDGSDLYFDVALSICDDEFYKGQFRIKRAYDGPHNIFISSVIHGLELLHMHIETLIGLDLPDAHISVGVIEVEGQLTAREVFAKHINRLYETDGCTLGNLDPEFLVGIFPSIRPNLFIGDYATITNIDLTAGVRSN